MKFLNIQSVCLQQYNSDIVSTNQIKIFFKNYTFILLFLNETKFNQKIFHFSYLIEGIIIKLFLKGKVLIFIFFLNLQK